MFEETIDRLQSEMNKLWTMVAAGSVGAGWAVRASRDKRRRCRAASGE
jgi:hypothetical protein